jgi:hypothetical protein
LKSTFAFTLWVKPSKLQNAFYCPILSASVDCQQIFNLNPAVGVSRRYGYWVERRESRVEGRRLGGGMRKPEI